MWSACRQCRPGHVVDRENPYNARVIDTRQITTDDAIARVFHLALEIDPEVVRYQPGDALGVWANNDPVLVSEILQMLELEGKTEIELAGKKQTLLSALLENLELTLLHPAVVLKWAEVSDASDLSTLKDDARSLREFASQRQFIDLIGEYPGQISAQSLVDILQPLQPRLYSIASSQKVYQDEVHLTVSSVEYHAFGRDHRGAASGHLAGRLQDGDELRVYVAENPAFRLPESGDAPVILIGAGTGIAPYRAFLQQRQVQGATGSNWLIFGNRHFKRDFLYQQDWVALRKGGLLARSSLAFSRDNSNRAYVQDRLLEEGHEIYLWLQEGAYLYVCGGSEMGRAVRETLHQVVRQYGVTDERVAQAYIDNLRSQGRYQRDVY